MLLMKIFLYFNIWLCFDDKSPLFDSCENEEPKITKYLIDKGLDIEEESSKKLLLETSSKVNYFKIIDYLLSKGVNPDVTNDDIFIKTYLLMIFTSLYF